MGKTYEGGVPLAEVVRSGFVEGVHRGSVVVLDAGGAVVAAAGDVDGPIFPRSSNKPLQAIGMLRCRPARWPTRPTWPWSARATSARTSTWPGSGRCCAAPGLDETALRCPPDLPLGEAARHAVLRCRRRPGPDPDELLRQARRDAADLPGRRLAAGGVLRPGHPLQERLRGDGRGVHRRADRRRSGVDGCGAPVLRRSR